MRVLVCTVHRCLLSALLVLGGTGCDIEHSASISPQPTPAIARSPEPVPSDRLAESASNKRIGDPLAAVVHTQPPAPGADAARTEEAPLPPIEFIRQGLVPFTMDVSIDPEFPVVISGTPLPEPAHDHVRAVLRRELERYPKGVLSKPDATVLSSVFVFEALTINGRSVSGAYIIGIVFISAGAFDGPGLQDDASIARTLHHELSSLFRLAFPRRFDEPRFRESLPPGFVYDDEKPGADTAAIFQGVNAPTSLEALADGFIAQYATTNFGQDFNSYAEVLLWKPQLLLSTFAPDSRVGRKARTVRDFYIAIDNRFEALFTTPAE